MRKLCCNCSFFNQIKKGLVYDAHVVAPDHKCRYDTALAINTMGVKHIIEIASQCAKLELLLLVSTGET